MLRVRPLLICVLVLAGTMATPAVRSQSGADVVDLCRQSGGSDQLCGGVQHLLSMAGRLCRNAGGGDACNTIDGRQINEQLVAAHERSWIAKALELQRGLDDDVALQEELWLHTHNSSNNEADSPTLANIDPNQVYSVRDQLRMGVRAIELDLHWAPHPSGDPLNGLNAVVLCHGEPIDFGVLIFHLGCTVDRLFREGLLEIRAWMNEHPDEVLLLYLENGLDDDPTAHDLASKALTEVLGDVIYDTESECANLPVDISRNEIRAAGARVLLTGNCGAGGAWGGLVHQRGPRWNEKGLSYGDDFPAYPCVQERATHDYPNKLIRRYGAETGLELLLGEGGDVSPLDALNMARCGVNLLGMDNLVPFDGRTIAAVWSWAVDEPTSGACAYHGTDGRFYADDCVEHRPFVCLTAPGQWVVTSAAGAWSEGGQRCADIGADFAVPKNGYDNERLKQSKGGGEAWLNYSEIPDAGWTPGAA